MERKPRKTKQSSIAKAGPRTTGRPAAFQPVESPAPEDRPATRSAKDDTGAVSAPAEGDLRSRIQERAYFIFASRGYQHGQALDHWLEAERQVSGRDEGVLEG